MWYVLKRVEENSPEGRLKEIVSEMKNNREAIKICKS